jgi:hypothetical protein
MSRHRRVRQRLRDIPADRGELHAGPDGAARPVRPGLTALDLRAHHQGARPAHGHADIFREQIDGTTGD